MNDLKTGVSAVCTALIVMGLMRWLLPEKGMKRSVEIVFSVAVLLTILLPVANGLKLGVTLPALSRGQREIVDYANKQTLELACDRAATAVRGILKENGIDTAEVAVIMDKNEDGGIFIECVKISGVKQEAAIAVQGLVASALGINTESVEVADG